MLRPQSAESRREAERYAEAVAIADEVFAETGEALNAWEIAESLPLRVNAEIKVRP